MKQTSASHRVLFAVSLTLAVSLACPGQEAKPGPTSLPSIVTLGIQAKDGKTRAGNAFLAVKEGVLVTALHIIKDAAKITATFPNGEEFDCPGLIDKDERRNVALLRIKSFGRPLLKIDPGELAVGDQVTCPVVKDGAFGVVGTAVTGIRIDRGVKLYVLSGEIPLGNNGSPLLNGRGEVVGVQVSVTEDGRDLSMALPSAYILGLEPSLPPQPWSPAAAPAGPGAPAAPSPNDAVDAGIASALISVHDIYCSTFPMTLNIFWTTKYSTLDNAVLYGWQSSLDNVNTQLEWLKTDDPLREKVIQAAGQLFARMKASLEYDIKCNVLNNDNSGKNTAQAEDFSKRAISTLNSVLDQISLLTPDFRRLAEISPEFMKALPIEMRYFLGLAERRSKLYLGAQVSSVKPYYLINSGTGLADKLGLRSGDTIISAGGREFQATDDIEEFKLLIEANLGRVLEVVVDRKGKRKTLQSNIPAKMPEKFLLNQRYSIWP